MTHDHLYNLLNYKILFSKLILITKYIFISFIKYPVWIVNIFSFLYLCFYNQVLLKKFKIFYIILFVNIMIVYGVYLHTPYDLEFLLKVTLDRLLFQTSGIYFIFTILSLNIAFTKNKNI